ncbi:unnamed protein product [Gongylonema pulchrum]|uniref:Secreted protein n=1 Tax=Gongylonema pulchrum TaxID=637853 RepID=A0A183CZ16_9BILA|nr:unnamed protein product [Gongylonema pulchrum]
MLYRIILMASSLPGMIEALGCIISGKHAMNGQVGGSSESKHICRKSSKYCIKVQSEFIINGGTNVYIFY